MPKLYAERKESVRARVATRRVFYALVLSDCLDRFGEELIGSGADANEGMLCFLANRTRGSSQKFIIDRS